MSNMLPSNFVNNYAMHDWLDHFEKTMMIQANDYDGTFTIFLGDVKEELADTYTKSTIDEGLKKACQAMRQIGWNVNIEDEDVYFSPSS